jgi:hypothetical protein
MEGYREESEGKFSGKKVFSIDNPYGLFGFHGIIGGLQSFAGDFIRDLLSPFYSLADEIRHETYRGMKVIKKGEEIYVGEVDERWKFIPGLKKKVPAGTLLEDYPPTESTEKSFYENYALLGESHKLLLEAQELAKQGLSKEEIEAMLVKDPWTRWSAQENDPNGKGR